MRKIFISIVLMSAPFMVCAQPTTPIHTCDELQAITNDLAGNYELIGNSIDCSNTAFYPIGNLNKEFTGHFNGNNVPIEGLVINFPNNDHVGLFGAIAGEAYIENVKIVDAVASGKNNVGLLVGARTEAGVFGTSVLLNNEVSGRVQGSGNVGGLIGMATFNDNHESLYMRNNTVKHIEITPIDKGFNTVGGLIGRAILTSIDNCHVEGSIISNEGNNVGGLVGLFVPDHVKIKGSSANIVVNIPAGNDIGGLIGFLQTMLANTIEGAGIESAFAIVDINGNKNVGGLVGNTLIDGTVYITNSYATGRVSAAEIVGGLVGFARNLYIENSYAQVDVTASRYYAGGLLGTAYDEVFVHNAYATGKVTAPSSVGGLIGAIVYDTSLIHSSYATGLVTATDVTPYQGGLIGDSFGDDMVVNCFWDIETTGQSESYSGGLPASTEQLQTQEFYTPYGWNFYDVWQPLTGDQYPQFQYQIKNED